MKPIKGVRWIVLTLAFAVVVTAAQHLFAGSGAQILGADAMQGFIGAAVRCCKITGGENCQQCWRTAKNNSHRYNMGPVANMCASWDDIHLQCDMSGIVVCGTAAGGGMQLVWENNEDCLGVPTRQIPGDYSIKTAAGTWCPEE
jgi:hypothetical protein